MLSNFKYFIYAPFIFFALPAEGITGIARGIDGDTLRVSGISVRLQGIDAPERQQNCRKGVRIWPCGLSAAKQLRLALRGRPIVCLLKGIDKYERALGECYYSSGAREISLSAFMVNTGWAFAYTKYSPVFVTAEARARAGGLGMWDSEIQPPWLWRRAKKALVTPISPP